MDTALTALRAYAAMVNTGDVSRLAPLLPEDFCNESQTVLASQDREGFLQYMESKLTTIRDAGQALHAEMGMVFAYGREQPCVVLAHPSKADLVALILATVADDQLSRLDLCIIPSAAHARRSGEYPR